MISGEITKNIFTLYQVQKKKLKKRREELDKATEGWKSYFDDQEKEKGEE
jgi:regulator of RNase E activity RraB